MITLSDVERSSRLSHLAVPATLLYCSVFPLVQVGVVAGGTAPGAWAGADGVRALVVTACYLPLHLRHVLHAARGSRPPAGGWTLAALTVLVAAPAPVLGASWLPTFHVIGVSALIVLRRPWSLLAVAGVVAAQAPLALALDSPLSDAASYYTVTVVWRTASVYLPVWLVGAARQLEAARRALADEAVVRERLRIDGELRRTLGTGLDAIVTRGGRAGELVDRDHAAAARELRDLVEGSRRTLAAARQMTTGYQRPSLRSELDTAASLLRAAGVETRLELGPGALPDAVDDTQRTALRSATARLLADDRVRACVITVSCLNGRVRLDLRRDDAPAKGVAT